MPKPLHFISFSGGRTSAYMTYRLLREEGHLWDFVVTFANTGREHPKTLDFVHRCDVEFGFNVVWLEAVVHPGDVACTHKVVTYETADRDGKVFEAVIAKYGLPNMQYKHCTREMKWNVQESYRATLTKNPELVPTAIGIRYDEPKRHPKPKKTPTLFPGMEPVKPEAKVKVTARYPLIEWRVTKPDVLDWWSDQAFDLGIEEFEGNCLHCFEKSTPKQMMQIDKDPTALDWVAQMEQKYPDAGAKTEKPRRWFRGNMTSDMIRALHAESKNYRRALFDPEENGGCSESCEFLPTGEE